MVARPRVRDLKLEGLGVVLPDMHLPHETVRPALAAALDAIKRLRPAFVLDTGDGSEFQGFSSYADPKKGLESVEDEARKAAQVYREIRAAMPPKARLIVLEGNHETRPTRWCLEHAPQLVASFWVPRLLDLQGVGAEWIPQDEQPIAVGSLLCIHGNQLGKTVQPAVKFLKNYGASGFFGHYHSLQIATGYTYAGGLQIATALPCLRTLDPAFMGGPSTPNRWINGFGVVTIPKRGRSAVDAVIVEEGRGVYAGQAFGG